MGERKVLNKYFPPDFNPAKISRKLIGKKNQINVRTMVSMNIRCNLCGHYIGKGTKVNGKKEEDIDKKYLGVIRVFRFYFKCPVCCAEITILTDPKNSDYTVESGATRNLEPWREEEDVEVEEEDSMKSLENRARDSKREMDKLAALHELKSMKSRHSKFSFASLVNNLYPKGEGEDEEDKLSAEDETIINSRFRGGTGEFVRRINDEHDWEDESSPVKKRKVSNPTDLLLSEGSNSSSILGSSSTPGGGTFYSSCVIANTFKVKKKSHNDNRQGKISNNALEYLFQDYGSDEEN